MTKNKRGRRGKKIISYLPPSKMKKVSDEAAYKDWSRSKMESEEKSKEEDLIKMPEEDKNIN